MPGGVSPCIDGRMFLNSMVQTPTSLQRNFSRQCESTFTTHQMPQLWWFCALKEQLVGASKAWISTQTQHESWSYLDLVENLALEFDTPLSLDHQREYDRLAKG